MGRKDSYRVGCFPGFKMAVILAVFHSAGTVPRSTPEGVSASDERGWKLLHMLCRRNLERTVFSRLRWPRSTRLSNMEGPGRAERLVALRQEHAAETLEA